jgi:hypothetical protein
MAFHSPPLLSAKPPSLPPALHLAKPSAKKVEKLKAPSIFDKKDFPFKEIKHSPRVSSWFTHPEIPLKGENYCKLTGAEKEEATWKHAFSTLVELFIGTEYSIRGSWDNPTTGKKDLLYCIPAEIIINGETHRGVFQFCFDGQGEMYHRFFGKTSNVEFIDKVIEIVRGKIEFPTLLESLRMKEEGTKQTIVVNGAEKGSFQVSPPFDIVTINDTKVVIKLFKIIK